MKLTSALKLKIKFCSPLRLLVIALASTTAFSAALGATDSLCKPDEKIVFSCPAKKKIVSVCLDDSKQEKSIQYRFGSLRRVEISIPESGVTDVTRGNLMYSGGGGAYLRFKNAGLDYIVFSKLTNHGKDEKQGVIVAKNGKRITSLACRSRSAQFNFASLPVPAEPTTEPLIDDE